jgi:hypothetical protein
MADLLRVEEVKVLLRDAVVAAGGAKVWLRQHQLHGFDHALHMVQNGDYATDERFLEKLGLRRVIRYEVIAPTVITQQDC